MRDLSRYQTAIIDWGIGGLSVHREIKRLDPERGMVYFSDSGSVPYGKLSRHELLKRVSRVCEFLSTAGITEIVLACNAASTVAEDLRTRNGTGIRLVDVVSSGIRIVEQGGWRRVGIIGGRRTILSGIYQRALRDQRRKIMARIAQPLSAMVERGELHGPAVSAALQKILRPLAGIDALLLACTHYPALSPAMKQVLPQCRILDPAAVSAREVVRRKSSRKSSRAADLFLTTGDSVQSRRSAKLAFGVDVNRFERIALPDGISPRI